MQTLVTMLDDVYPHGCLGDVVAVDEAAVKELKAVAKVRKHEVYEVVSNNTPEEPKADAGEVKAPAPKAGDKSKAEEPKAEEPAK